MGRLLCAMRIRAEQVNLCPLHTILYVRYEEDGHFANCNGIACIGVVVLCWWVVKDFHSI